MEYTIIVNNRSYDLPKKTIAVVEKLDQVLKVDASNLPIRQKFERLHNFMKELVGTDAAIEMFGSDNLAEIDLSDVTIAVRKVVDAYDKPVNDYGTNKMSDALSHIPIEKIIAMSKAAEKMSAHTSK